MRQLPHASPLALLLLIAGCASNQGCTVPAADVVVPQVIQAPVAQVDPALLSPPPFPRLPNPDKVKSDDDYATSVTALFGDDMALRLQLQTIGKELAIQDQGSK